MATITIGTPINNRGWILPHFLNHIYNINYNKKCISLYFLLNNSTDNSESILHDFKNKHKNEYKEIKIDKFKSHYNFEDVRSHSIRYKYTYHHLAKLRNSILRKVESDYLLSIDSDILVPSNILKKLLSHNKDIVSGLLYNGYIRFPEEYWKYPNILKCEDGIIKHINNWYVKNAPSLNKSKLFEVDVTGAAILMTNKVAKNTAYSWNSRGEDFGWSEDCQNKGFKLYCDVSAYCSHIMNEDMLKNVKGELG